MHTCSLDLGCGATPRNHYNADRCVGVDLVGCRENNVIAHDLRFGDIPFGDNTFDFVTAFDFIEHISRFAWMDIEQRHVNSFIRLINDISRVLKPNGKFFHKTPCYPHQEAFMDPTHVNIITEKTIVYFARIPLPGQFFTTDVYSFLRPLASSYGIDTSLILMSSKTEGFHLEQELFRY